MNWHGVVWREAWVRHCRVGVFGPRLDDRLRLWRRTMLRPRRRGHERRASFEAIMAAGIMCSNGVRLIRQEYWHPVWKVYVSTTRYEGPTEKILETLTRSPT